MRVIGNHAIRTAASLAAVGKFTEARATTILTEKLLRKARFMAIEGHNYYYYNIYTYVHYFAAVRNGHKKI